MGGCRSVYGVSEDGPPAAQGCRGRRSSRKDYRMTDALNEDRIAQLKKLVSDEVTGLLGRNRKCSFWSQSKLFRM